MALHPDAQAFLTKMANTPQPNEIPLAEFRRAAAAVIATGSAQQIGRVEDVVICGGDSQPMKVRIYAPEGGGLFPVLVWVHGGSFVRGTLDMFDAGRRAFVKASGCSIVAVEQRLSPEAQFPAPLNDVYAAMLWAHEHAAEFGGNPSLIGVAGESSGSNIAAAAAILARDKGRPHLSFQLLLEPLLDARCATQSINELSEGYLLTKRQLVWAYQQYAPGIPLDQPLISPLCAGDLHGLPPAVIVTLEYDPVRDEGEQYAAKLAAAGVRVLSARIPGMVHHFPGPDMLPTAVRLLRELLQKGSP
ncbi:MAG: Alpha/beta hydrolase fold-3 domain protein [Gammaproteobacteria bacterium]|nr:Alpha/beta hydrolase fold-3 domain protein [Gammaproteobacteria bacterium]